MTVTINISKINDIYRSWQPSGQSGAPQPGDEKPRAAAPVDRVTLSIQVLRKDCDQKQIGQGPVDESQLEPEEKQQLDHLRQRDTEVKAHEQAHMASGGGLVQGGATYQFQTGPDGKMYAVGGEVTIDLSPERTPEATIRKMQQVRRAALAPSEPSGTDRAVAAQASQIEAQARSELSSRNQEDLNTEDGKGNSAPAAYQPAEITRGGRIDLTI